jgi:hypothetical protein
MLTAAIEGYVSSLTEREFDAPFIALLRLHGFVDIHFLHGPFEFGKDFIAKRVEDGVRYQYVFQTKAGDLSLSDWHECRGQIDMLRTNVLAHPNFATDLPRQARFVTTGRLVGGASLAAQQYADHLRTLRELEFLTWDKESIVEMVAVSPEGLSGPRPTLLRVLGSQREFLNFSMLEKHSRNWIRNEPGVESLRDVIETAIIAQHCRREDRIDLACYTALMLARSSWATAHGKRSLPETISIAIEDAKNLFRYYASELWNRTSGKYLEPDALVREDRTPAGFVTYPVRCLIIIEILALYALLEGERNPGLSAEITHYLADFVTKNQGAAHPISDHSGISVACCALQLFRGGKNGIAKFYIRSVIKWLADHYDEGKLGLAGPNMGPEVETQYLLGSAFEHVTVVRNSASYTATQVLDLCSVMEDQELYDLARNEFLAVEISLPVKETDDTLGQYRIDSDGQHYEPNVAYEQTWNPSEGWKVAPHHKRGPELYYPELTGEAWDQMAISCVVRDRHFVQTWRRLAHRVRQPST